MKVLVFGATGRTGRQLVAQALARGHAVSAFVRDAGKVTVTHGQLTVVSGDVSDANAVARAVEGEGAVFSALGARSPLRPYAAFTEGIRHIVGAMERGDVERLVYLSFLGVAGGRHQLRFPFKVLASLLLPGAISDHQTNEERIRQSRLAWTVVRAPKLTDGPARSDYRGGEDIIAPRFPSIARADVAAFMLDQLTDSRFLRRAPAVLA